MRKLDENIPSGFYWSMMHGNGFAKSVSITAYLTNVLQDNDKLPPWADDKLTTSIVAYFGTTDQTLRNSILDNVGRDKVYNAVDDMLNKININIIGIDFGFERGTAEGIFDFVRTGSLETLNSKYNGEWLSNKVFSFADQKLKLPAGTTNSLYTSYRQYSAAQKLNAFWKQPIEKLQNAQAFKDLRGTMPESTTPADVQKSGQQAVNRQMKEITAAAVSLVINLAFSKEVQKFENLLGLVPGTGSMLVTMLIQAAFGLPVSPMQIAMFVVMNLFGVYKVKYICSANRTHPDGRTAISMPADSARWDIPGFADFNGEDASAREQNFIKIAQYKADRLALDLYEMPYRTGDEKLVPLQVMTGRTESVMAAQPFVLNTVCKNLGIKSFEKGNNGLGTAICSGTKVGIWQNPQTTDVIHIGT